VEGANSFDVISDDEQSLRDNRLFSSRDTRCAALHARKQATAGKFSVER
jgi:hypothetical protein